MPKSEDKYVVKVFNWSEAHLYEITCYKIHTLVVQGPLKNKDLLLFLLPKSGVAIEFPCPSQFRRPCRLVAKLFYRLLYFTWEVRKLEETNSQALTTDKRTDVWFRDFIIWKINSGLDCEIKGSGPIMSNFWGPFFYFFRVKKSYKFFLKTL